MNKAVYLQEEWLSKVQCHGIVDASDLAGLLVFHVIRTAAAFSRENAPERHLGHTQTMEHERVEPHGFAVEVPGALGHPIVWG